MTDDGLLRTAADPAKDQSYMLAALAPASLARLRFPLGELTKPEVRALAREAGLPVADKRESQDLCFLAGTGKARLPRPPRRRRATGRGRSSTAPAARSAATPAPITSPSASARASASPRAEPLYVLATDARANTVTVGPRAALATARVRGPRRGPAPAGRRGRPGAAALPRAPAAVPRHRATATARSTVALDEPVDGAAPGQVACLHARRRRRRARGHRRVRGRRVRPVAGGRGIAVPTRAALAVARVIAGDDATPPPWRRRRSRRRTIASKRATGVRAQTRSCSVASGAGGPGSSPVASHTSNRWSVIP